MCADQDDLVGVCGAGDFGDEVGDGFAAHLIFFAVCGVAGLLCAGFEEDEGLFQGAVMSKAARADGLGEHGDVLLEARGGLLLVGGEGGCGAAE